MSQLKAPIADAASVDAAIENRFCVRAFSPAPVPRQSIEDILRVASRSPSGTNAQPWQVYVLQGASRDALRTMPRGGCHFARSIRGHS